MIKIDDVDYTFRYKLDELTLDDYLRISDILNTDEYDTYFDKTLQKDVNRREPKAKEDRSDEFMAQLYRDVIKSVSNIRKKHLDNDELVYTMLTLLKPAFEAVHEIAECADYPTFTMPMGDDESIELKYNDISTWNFDQWVTYEILTGRGIQELDAEGNKVTVMDGNRYTIPLCFTGIKYDKELSNLNEKVDYFNKILSIDVTYPIFIRILRLVSDIRKAHPFIYNESGSSEANTPNMSQHYADFGWLSTLTDVAEKGVFGTYIQTKEAPLFEVLEYLNTSSSKSAAEVADYDLRNNK